MKKTIYLIGFFLSTGISVDAQVKIGGSGTPSPSAILELESNNRGFSPPRVNLSSTTMPLNGTTVPADGVIVYSSSSGLEGPGLYAWYNGRWNKVNERSSMNKIARARFLGRVTTTAPDLQWDPSIVNQMEGLAPMWESNSPTKITVRSTGLYLVSVSYRKEQISNALIFIAINGTTHGLVQYWADKSSVITATYTHTFYLQDGDVITAGDVNGNVINSLGTTQLALSQIPVRIY
ncbi:MAG: hypothetical protein EOO85_24610 [Pedobacter sp.]|nr:MAG: hypothetical protein EOO85_24610 [Pedobacter sp.]